MPRNGALDIKYTITYSEFLLFFFFFSWFNSFAFYKSSSFAFNSPDMGMQLLDERNWKLSVNNEYVKVEGVCFLFLAFKTFEILLNRKEKKTIDDINLLSIFRLQTLNSTTNEKSRIFLKRNELKNNKKVLWNNSSIRSAWQSDQ